MSKIFKKNATKLRCTLQLENYNFPKKWKSTPAFFGKNGRSRGKFQNFATNYSKIISWWLIALLKGFSA